MQTEIRFALSATALLVCSGCDAASKPTSTAPPPTSTAAATSASSATAASGAPSAAPTSTRSAYPVEGRPSITFRIANRSGLPRYTRPNRGFFDAVKVERKVADAWQSVGTQVPTCSEPCPFAKPRCASSRCRPPMPRAETIEQNEKKERSWGGQEYETISEGSCWCHREVAAPHGSYRLEACVFAACTGPGCPPGDAPSAGEPLCFRTEFEHTGKDQVVTVTIDK